MANVGFQCSVRGIEVTFQGTQWLLLASPLIGHMSQGVEYAWESRI